MRRRTTATTITNTGLITSRGVVLQSFVVVVLLLLLILPIAQLNGGLLRGVEAKEITNQQQRVEEDDPSCYCGGGDYLEADFCSKLKNIGGNISKTLFVGGKNIASFYSIIPSL